VLNARRVHLIRTSGLTDSHLSRLWRTSISAVRHARTGVTWKRHPTPPDLRPRIPAGRLAPPKARIKAVAVSSIPIDHGTRRMWWETR
jgi:hypothetical protein